LGDIVRQPGIVGEVRRVPGEIAGESQGKHERCNLEHLFRPAGQAVGQQADADHVARLEGVREAEKRHGRHAPGCELVAGGDVHADLAPGGKPHHQQEDDDEEQAGQPARAEIEAVQRFSQPGPSHARSFRHPVPP
jgi:hypothetical protein